MPADDIFFKKINNVQYIWYQNQLILDEKERYELYRDVAEYNAMFSNPEGVKKIRNSRENTHKASDEDFEEMIENLFGRKINKNDEKGINKMDDYIDMELDEIKFIPLGD